jgi:hypothetical protein
MKFDITKLTLAADNLLPTLTNPRHIAIITNYRRHAIFEVSGKYERILAPDMSVEEPDYWLHMGGASVNLKGMAQIWALYKSLVLSNTCVQMLTDEVLTVHDWGFSSEATFHHFEPGWFAIMGGAVVDDADAIYVKTTKQSMHWNYDDRNRMIGERVWIGGGSYRKCPPEEVITREEAWERLEPLLDNVPYAMPMEKVTEIA